MGLQQPGMPPTYNEILASDAGDNNGYPVEAQNLQQNVNTPQEGYILPGCYLPQTGYPQGTSMQTGQQHLQVFNIY